MQALNQTKEASLVSSPRNLVCTAETGACDEGERTCQMPRADAASASTRANEEAAVGASARAFADRNDIGQRAMQPQGAGPLLRSPRCQSLGPIPARDVQEWHTQRASGVGEHRTDGRTTVGAGARASRRGVTGSCYSPRGDAARPSGLGTRSLHIRSSWRSQPASRSASLLPNHAFSLFSAFPAVTCSHVRSWAVIRERAHIPSARAAQSPSAGAARSACSGVSSRNGKAVPTSAVSAPRPARIHDTGRGARRPPGRMRCRPRRRHR